MENLQRNVQETQAVITIGLLVVVILNVLQDGLKKVLLHGAILKKSKHHMKWKKLLKRLSKQKEKILLHLPQWKRHRQRKQT